jgi:hypothetical protein
VVFIIQADIGGWVGMINVRSITGQQLVKLLSNLRQHVAS